MKKNNELLIGLALLSAIFPYINFGVTEAGVQPLFHIIAFLILYRDSKINVIKIMTVVILLISTELILSLSINDNISNANLPKVMALTLIISYKYLASIITYNYDGLYNYKLMKIIPIILFISMILIFMNDRSAASDFNFLLTGATHYTDLKGITYFSNEPGLASFGIFSLILLYLFGLENNKLTSTFLIIIGVLLLLSTLSGTAVVLIMMLIMILLNLKRYFTILTILVILFGLAIIVSTNTEFINHPIERMNQLINMNEYTNSSPALRVENILNMSNDFFSMYTNRNEYGDHGVGVVSYLTEIPITTSLFIAYGLLNLSILLIPVFIFSIIMLPLSSPFFFIIFLINHCKNIYSKRK